MKRLLILAALLAGGFSLAAPDAQAHPPGWYGGYGGYGYARPYSYSYGYTPYYGGYAYRPYYGGYGYYPHSYYAAPYYGYQSYGYRPYYGGYGLGISIGF